MNIVTEADTTGWAPRDCRYSAHDDDTWDGAPDSRTRSTIGYGATPEAAIADLMALLADDIRYDTDWLREKGNRMSDITDDLRGRLRATRERLRERIRELELDAVLIRGKIEEACAAIAALDEVIDDTPRRKTRRKITVINLPRSITGGTHVPGSVQEPETDEQLFHNGDAA